MATSADRKRGGQRPGNIIAEPKRGNKTSGRAAMLLLIGSYPGLLIHNLPIYSELVHDSASFCRLGAHRITCHV